MMLASLLTRALLSHEPTRTIYLSSPNTLAQRTIYFLSEKPHALFSTPSPSQRKYYWSYIRERRFTVSERLSFSFLFFLCSSDWHSSSSGSFPSPLAWLDWMECLAGVSRYGCGLLQLWRQFIAKRAVARPNLPACQCWVMNSCSSTHSKIGVLIALRVIWLSYYLFVWWIIRVSQPALVLVRYNYFDSRRWENNGFLELSLSSYYT